MIIQIYEIQTEAEADLALSLGVDHIGCVIVSEHQSTDRNIRSAIEITRQAGKKSSLIPLFSDISAICRCLEYYQPDIVHFCESIAPGVLGKKSIDHCITIQKRVRQRFAAIKIMRSIPIAEPGSSDSDSVLELADRFGPYSDYFLTDTILNPDGKLNAADQPVNGFVGITGRTCDWDIAAELVAHSTTPVILAGGLGPDNVKDAILKVNPFGVDSCTATNAQDDTGRAIRFKKDPQKLRRFIRNIREAEH